MAEVITSGKVIQKPEIVLEVDDFLPPGLQGVRSKTADEAGPPKGLFSGGSSTNGTLQDPIVEGDGTTPPTPDGTGGSGIPGSSTDFDDGVPVNGLPIPDDMKIISQTLRVGPDGKVTVDVVIETSDIPGITEFEVRITRDS